MRISVETIGRKFKTRQTPRGQRQASLLTSTAAKNRLWSAPAQMRIPDVLRMFCCCFFFAVSFFVLFYCFVPGT